MVDRVNVAERMQTLPDILREQFRDEEFELPLRPECQNCWTDAYAYACGFYIEWRWGEPPSCYFDNYQLEADIEKCIRAHFGDESLTFRFNMHGKQDLEVYYEPQSK